MELMILGSVSIPKHSYSNPIEASDGSKNYREHVSNGVDEINDSNRSLSLFPLDESDADTDATIGNEDEDCEFVLSGRRSNSLGLSIASGLSDVKKEFFSSAEQSNNKKNEFDSAHEQSSGQNGAQQADIFDDDLY